MDGKRRTITRSPFVWICYPDALNISICNALNIQKAESFLVVLFLLITFVAHLRNNEMRTDTNLIPFNALSFSSMMMRMCR